MASADRNSLAIRRMWFSTLIWRSCLCSIFIERRKQSRRADGLSGRTLTQSRGAQSSEVATRCELDRAHFCFGPETVDCRACPEGLLKPEAVVDLITPTCS